MYYTHAVYIMQILLWGQPPNKKLVTPLLHAAFLQHSVQTVPRASGRSHPCDALDFSPTFSHASGKKASSVSFKVPGPSKGVKFQPPGLFLAVKGLKFQTLGRFRSGQGTILQNKLDVVVDDYSSEIILTPVTPTCFLCHHHRFPVAPPETPET